MMASTFVPGHARDDGRFGDTWRAIQFGLLWGLAITAMESRATPFGVIYSDLAGFLTVVGVFWCVKGILLAYFAIRIERRHRGAGLAGRMLLAAVVVSGLSLSWVTMLLPDGSIYRFRSGVSPGAIFWYDVWSTLFYAGLLVVGCIVAARANRMRRLLSQAEIDRGLTESLVAEIRLKELQSSVNPEALYAALAEVMRRYVAGSLAADRLLDCLVGFLRAAMPGLREATSTLSAELELTRAYVRLRAELEPDRGAWRIDVVDDVGSLRIPSLRLIEMLDHWTASATSPVGGVMAITRCAGGARVELRANAEPNGSAGLVPAQSPPSMIFDFFNPASLPGTG